MKIQMLLTNPFTGDVRVYKEAKYLVSRGHDVEVLCWDKTPEKGLPETEVIDGIKIWRFGIPAVEGSGMKQLGAFRKYIGCCRKHLKATKPDILHCHDLDGAITGRLCGRPYVFDMHEFYDKGKQPRKAISHTLARTLAKGARAVVCVAQISIDTYGKGIEDKFFTLKNYSAPEMFGEIRKTPSDKLRVSYIGTVRNQIPEMTALFDAAIGMDDVEVTIYGGGVDLEKLKRLASIYENVTVAGEFDGASQSGDIYRNTDVSYIAYAPENPNYQGQFEPVKLHEAICTKTPVIATQSLNPGKLAKELEIGEAVDTRDRKAVRKALSRFKDAKNKPDGFYETCVKNIEKIAGRYNWNEAVKILDEIY